MDTPSALTAPTTAAVPPVNYAELTAIISRVQSRFIRAAPPTEVFEPLLTDLLDFTRSQYGFIAEVRRDDAGTPFLRILVLTDVTWDAATRSLFEGQREGDAMEFHNLDSLWGTAVRSSDVVIANELARNGERGRLPQGHPEMNAFLAVPLFHGGDMVGLIGLANRPGGYDRALADFLQPLFASVSAIIGAVRLESDRREAERALRESEEVLRATFEMAAVGIAHIASDGRLLRVNPRLTEILGRPAGELLGMQFQQLGMPDDRDAEEREMKRLLDGDFDSCTLQMRHRRAQGDLATLSVNMTLVRDEAGAPAYFIAVVEDVTERQHAQGALLAAQAAERANAAKTEFLSRMSHELRTPLNAVLGFAQLLQMDSAQPLTPEQKVKMRHIENAGAHLLAMINDVLDLSRIESGGMPLTAERVRLSTAVQEAFALVAPSARDANVQLHLEPPAEESGADHVLADHLRLRQVLVNLLSNAIKYNHAEGRVTVRWSPSEDHESVRLQVIDTGQGLTHEQRAHLFEPFNRLGAERSSIEGTGIGLVVTQRLVQLMGGSITVDSQPGAGSVFTVLLPSAVGGHTRPGTLLDTPAEPPTPRRGPKRTILYAEDNPMNVDLVREVMRLREDCRLLVARSGREAIALALREHPHLLLLDMHLGDMSGLDVIERLAQDPRMAQVPAVALSADAMPAPIAAANRAGFKAYLTKPLNVGEFLRCVDEALGQSRSG